VRLRCVSESVGVEDGMRLDWMGKKDEQDELKRWMR
jgi:hypothetical protein